MNLTTQILEGLTTLQRTATHARANLQRLQDVVDLNACDGCGHWMPPHVLHPYGACLLCDPCWADFQREMQAMPREEYDPNEHWKVSDAPSTPNTH